MARLWPGIANDAIARMAYGPTTWPMRRPTSGGALHRRLAGNRNRTVLQTKKPRDYTMLAPVTDDRFERLQKQYGRELTLAALVEDGADQLPLPGEGETLQ